VPKISWDVMVATETCSPPGSNLISQVINDYESLPYSLRVTFRGQHFSSPTAKTILKLERSPVNGDGQPLAQCPPKSSRLLIKYHGLSKSDYCEIFKVAACRHESGRGPTLRLSQYSHHMDDQNFRVIPRGHRFATSVTPKHPTPNVGNPR